MHTTDAIQLGLLALQATAEPVSLNTAERQHLRANAEQARDVLAALRPLPRCALCGYPIDDTRSVRPLFVIDEDTGDMPKADGLAACTFCHNVVRESAANRAYRNRWTADTTY